jgi:precorrin-3B methylase
MGTRAFASMTLSEQLQALDPVRRMVATAVQHALVTARDCPARTARPPGVIRVSGRAVNATTTLVRVVHDDGRVREFQVRLNEVMNPAPED